MARGKSPLQPTRDEALPPIKGGGFPPLPLQEGQEVTYVLENPFEVRRIAYSDLFTDSHFPKEVARIHRRFSLSPHEKPLGVGNNATPREKKRHLELCNNSWAVCYNDEDLRASGIRKRSRAEEFQGEISSLLKEWELPERFRPGLTLYVVHGCMPHDSYEHQRVVLQIRRKHGLNHASLDVFGDTTLSDLKRLWKKIKYLLSKQKVPGSQLFRESTYFQEKMRQRGDQPIDPTTGNPIPVIIDAHVKATRKSRYRKRHGR